MAYTVTQSTTGVQGTADDLVYVVVDTTNVSEPKYRYVCRIQVGGQTLIRLKQLPNNSNAAVFNIYDIARTVAYQDANPYSLGLTNLDGQLDTTQIFSINTNALKEISLTFGYEYAVNDQSAPQETLLPATNQEVTVVNGYFSSADTSLPLPTTASDPYKMINNRALFLSDATYGGIKTYPVAYDGSAQSRAALAFLNGNDVGSTGSSYLHVTYYNGDQQLNTGYFTNNTTYGGKAPAVGLNDAQSLLYVGIGPFNLNSQSINGLLKPSHANNVGWTHYDVQMASSTTLTGNQRSEVYRFDRLQCTKYFSGTDSYTLHWWNSKGGVDSLPCTGKRVRTEEQKRTTYRTLGGNGFEADGTSPAYVRTSYEGGKQTSHVKATTSLRLSVDMGSPDVLTPFVESLMRSERVYLSGTGKLGYNVGRTTTQLVQCVVKDSSVEYLEGVNDQAVTYVFNVELSRYLPYQ